MPIPVLPTIDQVNMKTLGEDDEEEDEEEEENEALQSGETHFPNQ